MAGSVQVPRRWRGLALATCAGPRKRPLGASQRGAGPLAPQTLRQWPPTLAAPQHPLASRFSRSPTRGPRGQRRPRWSTESATEPHRPCTSPTHSGPSATTPSPGARVSSPCTSPTRSSVSGGYAFDGCAGIAALRPPLASIGTAAFRGCTGVVALHLPDGLTSVGDDAFDGCTPARASSTWSCLPRPSPSACPRFVGARASSASPCPARSGPSATAPSRAAGRSRRSSCTKASTQAQ